jgi:hypothetical protein
MHMNTLDTPMLIRRAGYELEITVDHQLKFLKAFGPALLKAHSDVEGLAESIKIPKLALPAPQAIKLTPKPVTAPSSMEKPMESPAKAKCACGFHFLQKRVRWTTRNISTGARTLSDSPPTRGPAFFAV